MLAKDNSKLNSWCVMKKKLSFENSIIFTAVFITLIPLILSYSIFISSKLEDIDENIRDALKETGFCIAQNNLVQEKLYRKENDFFIQQYTKGYIDNFRDVDLIVVGDMEGVKYSHLDEKQIGEVYINDDKQKVLENGSSYYSIMEGSMGITLRWFQPIFYEGEQVGFVMVGRYYEAINMINSKTKMNYLVLFIFGVLIAIIASKIFARRIKRAILDMEPEEISMLYNQKNIIINTVKEGIIALDKKKKVVDINNGFYELFNDFNMNDILSKLKVYIDDKLDLEMKEFIIQNKKIFVTIKHIAQGNNYLGAVITFVDKKEINKIAKEITGIDEVIKNLRANVHEFKNNIHVIFGLIQLKEYEEAKKYILNIQQLQENNSSKFKKIEDYYVKALLLSRELVAKERKIKFELTDESFLDFEHGIIDSYDLVTILGNLIENAFEACSLMENEEKEVEVSLYEDKNIIEIQVRDNGKEIQKDIKEFIFKEGVSSKGEGRGTGLFLVKSRVELYNGHIEIEEFNDEKIFFVIIYKGE